LFLGLLMAAALVPYFLFVDWPWYADAGVVFGVFVVSGLLSNLISGTIESMLPDPYERSRGD
jgi:hypothetical protein